MSTILSKRNKVIFMQRACNNDVLNNHRVIINSNLVKLR